MTGPLRVSKWDQDEVDDDGPRPGHGGTPSSMTTKAGTAAKVGAAAAAPELAAANVILARRHRSTRSTTPKPDTTPDPAAKGSPANDRAAGGSGDAGGEGGTQPRAFTPPAPSPSLPSVAPTLRPPRHLSASEGTGFAAGLVLYTLALNYLRHGWPGVTGWLSAKFLNRPMAAPEGKF